MPAMRYLLCALVSVFFLSPVFAAPQDTVVFIHGFLGWGRDEMFGVKYWGGPGRDYQADLRSRGISTVSVAVGPVSSNWDRAVEAYAQLQGGCADYGAAHAAQHGHARYGRCYSALLPQWDASARINIIGHSQGGQTGRVLAHLLTHGAPEEVAASGAQASALFRGGKHWVRSVTSYATPHQGTTLAKGLYTASFGMLDQMFAALGVVTGASPATSNVYDFKLDQWGLTRQPGEGFSSYLARVKGSALFQPGNTHDMVDADVSPEGALALNQWVKTVPDVYYFSLATASTWTSPLTGTTYPYAKTALLLQPTALWIGAYRHRNPAPGEVRIDDAWARNDGAANTVGMAAPHGATVLPFDRAKPQKGAWNYLGVYDGWDHMDIVGHSWDFNAIDWRDPTELYRSWGDYLRNLP